MTPDQKKSQLFDKLNEKPKPVVTKVVPAEPVKAKPAVVKPEHMNAYFPPDLAADMRMYKAKNKVSLIDIISDAVSEYLEKRDARTK